MIIVSLVRAPDYLQDKIIPGVKAVVVNRGTELVAVLGEPGVEVEGGDHFVCNSR